MSIRESLDRYDLFDNAILRHGFLDYKRDYEVVAQLIVGSGAPEVYRYLFRGCVEVHYESRVLARGFSMDDVFIDSDRWREAGQPEGFVWGVKWAGAYPGWDYGDYSDRSEEWSRKLNLAMHEFSLQTDTYS